MPLLGKLGPKVECVRHAVKLRRVYGSGIFHLTGGNELARGNSRISGSRRLDPIFQPGIHRHQQRAHCPTLIERIGEILRVGALQWQAARAVLRARQQIDARVRIEEQHRGRRRRCMNQRRRASPVFIRAVCIEDLRRDSPALIRANKPSSVNGSMSTGHAECSSGCASRDGCANR